MTEPRTYTNILNFLLASFSLISSFIPSTVITYTAPLAYASIEVSEPVVEIVENQQEPAVIETSEKKVCECVAYVRNQGVAIPKGYDAIELAGWLDILPTGVPTVGSVVVLKYGEKLENYHVALLTELQEEGFIVKEEIAIGQECVRRERFIEWNNYAILGYWNVPTK